VDFGLEPKMEIYLHQMMDGKSTVIYSPAWATGWRTRWTTPGLAGCSAVAVRAPRLSKLGTPILQLFGCFAGILGEAGPRPRTGDTMICSLGRYVSSRFCQLQNPPREAELLLSVFPDVSHRCFGLVSKLVSNENPPVSTALSAPGLYVWLDV
jgi:hypothetical protein